MKKRISIFTIVLTVGFFAITGIANSGDKIQTSVDRTGTYRGVLPCNGCDGVQTELTLNKNKTYDLITRFIGKGDAATRAISGSFSWNREGTVITLGGIKKDSGPTQYEAGENSMTQLDNDGNKITGEHASKYVLTKGSPSVEEKYWKLISLYGSTISPETGDRKEHHIMLKAEGNRLTGSSGCNTFSGDYLLNGENGVKISKISATKMACPVMDSESLFLKALEFIDGYAINSDTLVIYKANATPVAKFIAVYKKQ